MSNYFSDRDTITLPFVHPLTVAILEDNPRLVDELKTLLGTCGIAPIQIFSLKDAVELARNNETSFFILDIQINDSNLGLDILENVKEIQPSSFVCIYSRYIESPKLRRRAERLDADLIFLKTSNERLDICCLSAEILKRYSKLVMDELALVEMEIEQLKSGGSGYVNWTDGSILPGAWQRPIAKTLILDREPQDSNVIEYESLMSTPEWVEKHAGLFVGFIGGQLVDMDEKLEILLLRLRSRYPDEDRFIKHIDRNEDEAGLEMPTPLEIE